MLPCCVAMCVERDAGLRCDVAKCIVVAMVIFEEISCISGACDLTHHSLFFILELAIFLLKVLFKSLQNRVFSALASRFGFGAVV